MLTEINLKRVKLCQMSCLSRSRTSTPVAFVMLAVFFFSWPAYTSGFSVLARGCMRGCISRTDLRHTLDTYVCPLRRLRTGLTFLHMGLDDEMAAVRSMKVTDIKLELLDRGLATTDIFEKDEFCKRLAQARVDNIRKNSSNSPPPAGERDAAASAPKPPAQDSKKVREAATRAEVTAMRVSDIKAELAQKGVSMQGLFEKSEFVELLVKIRLATPGGGGGQGGRNPDFKDVQTTKMPKKEEVDAKKAQDVSDPFAAGAARGGANPFAGMGGMGGMGGIGNPFAGGSPSGGQRRGAGPQAGMNMQELMSKVMGNPQAMASVQKAMQNPKVSAALADIQRNPANAAKYMRDPEIASIVQDLQQYLR